MSDPRLTVALPVLNGDNYLAEAVESILAQSFGDFLLIVSDQHSTDGTWDMLQDFARRDRRVRPFRADGVTTLANNMNNAMRLSPGRWIKMFCHDDIMRADCLEQVNALIEKYDDSKLGLISNATRHMYPNGYITEDVVGAVPLILDGKEALRQNFSGRQQFNLPGVTETTVRKSAWESTGGFNPGYLHFDILCWLQLMVHHDFAFLPDRLATLRVHSQQVTHFARKSLAWLNEYRAFIPDFIDKYGDTIGLDWKMRLRGRAMPVSVAAKSVVLEMLGGRWSNVAAMARQLPLTWLPVLAPLVARSWFVERKRLREFEQHVPADLIVPGV